MLDGICWSWEENHEYIGQRGRGNEVKGQANVAKSRQKHQNDRIEQYIHININLESFN